MSSIERDTCFVALTRPQMFAGVTYSYFVANVVIATELFLIWSNHPSTRLRYETIAIADGHRS